MTTELGSDIGGDLGPEDLEPTDLGYQQGGSAMETSDRPRGRGRSTVTPTPGPSIGKPRRGGRKTNAQILAEKEEDEQRQLQALQKAAMARAAETQIKTRKVIGGMINPALASLAQLALQVPPQISWMEAETTAEGELQLDERGNPLIHYYNGANLVVIQPYEVEFACMIAPLMTETDAAKRLGEQAEKLAPVLLLAAGLGFAVTYAVRIRRTMAILEPQRQLLNQARRSAQQVQEDPNGPASGPAPAAL
jgi:hypothetical protein